MNLFFAAKGVIEKDGKVLLVREGGQYVDGTATGKWDMPGGRLEAHEKVRDGLLREIKEEVNLEVKTDMRPFYLGEWFPQPKGEKWHVVCNFFICEWQGGEVKLSGDHDEFRWVSASDWKGLPYASYIEDVLDAYWKK